MVETDCSDSSDTEEPNNNENDDQEMFSLQSNSSNVISVEL